MENKDIFFIGNQGEDRYFTEVVNQLLSKNCIYGYMSHSLIDAKDVELCFLDATLLSKYQHFEHAFDNVGWSFGSRVTIDSINDCRAEIYAALDRISPYIKSIAEKELYFNKLSGYYISFFEKHKGIKKIFKRQSPHMPWDILFCRIAMHFGIQVYSVDRGIPGAGFAIIWCGLGESAMKYPGQSLSKSRVNELYDNIINHNSANRLHAKSLLPHANKNNSIKRVLVKFFPWLRVLSVLKNRLMEPIPLQIYPASLDTKVCSSFAAEGRRVSRWSYILACLLYNNERLRRNNFLEVMGSKHPDYDSDYVYFPLHSQPEATTVPKGMVYREQILAIRRLREIIPDEITVYVKDHPRSLISDIRNKTYRSVEFYEEIMKLGGVELLHPELDSAGLIENSRLVVTIAGSAANEALPKGIPVIVFGNSFVEDCKAVHKIISCTHSNKSAVKGLLNKSTTEVKTDFLELLKCPNWHEVCDTEWSWKQVDYNYAYVSNLVDLVLRLGDSVNNDQQTSTETSI